MKCNCIAKVFLGLIFSLVAAFLFPDLSQASTWRVEQNGGGDYATIQPAVDGAAPGDTILIGPGNYTEATTVDYDSWSNPTDVFVDVKVGDLTFIGSSSDEVIIGPEEYYPTYQGPLGFGFKETPGTLRVESVTVRNVGNGCFSDTGSLELIGCKFENIEDTGIVSYSPNLFVDQCFFSEAEGAIVTFPPCSGIIINNSEITNGSIYVNGASDVVMENCSSIGGAVPNGGAGIQFDHSNGRVSNCEFTGHNSFSIGGVSGSNVLVEDSILISDGLVDNGRGIHATGSSIAVRNCIVDGSFSAFFLSSGAQVSVDSCDINTTGPWYVYSSNNGSPPIKLDFINNYWGTTDLELISSRILDSNDDGDLGWTILFEPVADGPLPTEKTTLDGLKAMFR